MFDFIETTKNLYLFFFLQNTIIQSTLRGICCCVNVVSQRLDFLLSGISIFYNKWVDFYDPNCLELVPKLYIICAPDQVCSIWSVLELLLVWSCIGTYLYFCFQSHYFAINDLYLCHICFTLLKQQKIFVYFIFLRIT